MVEHTDHIMRYFKYDHLTGGRQREISAGFAEMAHRIQTEIPRNPERTVALRKLLEAKDAAVRASLDEEDGQ